MVPTHREVLRYARNSDFDERDLSSWMAHCRKFCEAHGLSFGENLYRAVAEFQDGGE